MKMKSLLNKDNQVFDKKFDNLVIESNTLRLEEE